MAFDPEKFATLMRDNGYADDDIVKALRERTSTSEPKVPRGTPSRGMYPGPDLHADEAQTPMAPTGHPVDLSMSTEGERRSLDEAAARNPVEPGESLRTTIERHPQFEQDAAQLAHAGERRYDPVANDPLAQQILSGVVAGGAGKFVAPVGRLARGAAEGASNTAMLGGGGHDILTSTILGAGLRGLSRNSPSRVVDGQDVMSAFPPGSQHAADQGALEAVGAEPTLGHGAASGGMFDRPDYRALPQGERGTAQMAGSLESRLADTLTRHGEENGARLGTAEDAARQRLSGGVDTADAISEIQRIRMQRQGGQGSVSPESDARLRFAQHQLTSPAPGGGDLSHLSFDQLRHLQVELNSRLRTAAPGDYGKAGDVQAAGVVSGAMRQADPEFGGALGAYGQEEGRLAGVNDRLYGENGSIPPDRASRIKTATGRLASVGASDQHSAPSQILQEQQTAGAVGDLDKGASPLLAEIRARNVAKRRQLQMPSVGGTFPTAARAVAGNADNLMFRASGHGLAPGSDALTIWLEHALTPNRQENTR